MVKIPTLEPDSEGLSPSCAAHLLCDLKRDTLTRMANMLLSYIVSISVSPLIFVAWGSLCTNKWNVSQVFGRLNKCHVSHISNIFLPNVCQPCHDNEIWADLDYCTWFYCASNIILFSQIEGLWQPCVKQVCPCHFPNSVCLLCISVSHFGTSHNISNFLNSYCDLLWWPVIRDLWCYHYDSLKAQVMVCIF